MFTSFLARGSVALALLLLFFGLAGVPGADEKPARPTGKYRGDILDPATGEAIMRVAMQVPEKLPGEKHLGLLLLFHGFQGNEGNYIGLTVEGLKRLGLLDQYVVISGKSKGPGWTTEDDDRVLRLVRWAKETYPIDSRRLFIFGSSNGAAFVGRFGWEHQDLVAGVVGYCGGYKFAKDVKAERPAETKTEWYFVHGGKDNPQNSRRACDALKAKGYRYVFRQMDGYGHTDIWDSRGHPDSKKADAVRDDWLLWMHALRHKEMVPTDAEQKALTLASDKLKTATAEQFAPHLAEAARIGGPLGGEVILDALLLSNDPAIRAAAARTAERTLYHKYVTKALVRLLADESEQVREAAAKSLAVAATWRYADAQLALRARANDRTVPVADRVRAVEALGKVIRLPLLGNFEDGLPIWTLGRLLDDDEQKVREAAFVALGPNVEDAFDYKPGLGQAERKTAVEKWLAWCEKKCGPAPER